MTTIPLEKGTPLEEHRSVQGMSNEVDMVILQAGHPMTSEDPQFLKAPTILKESEVVFDALRMFGFLQAWKASQSLTVTGLMIAPSKASVTINTGSSIHTHRLSQHDSERSEGEP